MTTVDVYIFNILEGTKKALIPNSDRGAYPRLDKEVFVMPHLPLPHLPLTRILPPPSFSLQSTTTLSDNTNPL
jgi:hypothetical protein